MTNSLPQTSAEPSLPQARDAHLEDSHSHSHRHLRNRQHSHALSDDKDSGDPQYHDSQSHLDRRQEPDADDLNAFVTQVVQTISLVQYVDPAGHPFQIETLYAPPATVLVDPVSGNTIPIPPAEDQATAAAGGPEQTSDVPSPDDDSAPMPVSSPANAPSPAPSEILPQSSEPSPSPPAALPAPPPTSDLSLPTTPVSPPVSDPTPEPSAPIPNPPRDSLFTSHVSHGWLMTIATAQSSVPVSFPSNSNDTHASLAALSASSTQETQSFPSSLDFSNSNSDGGSKSTTFISESIFSSISTGLSTSTTNTRTSAYASSTSLTQAGAGGGRGTGNNGEADTQPTGSSSTDSGGSSGSELSPEHRQVIGGVVGGVAGAALFAVFVLLLLRYKKKKGGLPLFRGDETTNGRNLITEGGPGPSMTERAAPAAISAALSRLTSKGATQPRSGPGASTTSGERGFYRVSGKKLPSVLQTGGDGYTDPRESVMSGDSDYYRGSQEFDPASGGLGRLALGSPMRPVSGVPIMRDGPARIVTVPENPFAERSETNPFLDPPAPPGPRDPVGRSLVGQDGSRGSGSRFHERL
ncbi:hypothetical protein S40285_01568 [Stachybotrys chlorohalonatus IBT 40285]|uniref:Mid2 domain-containing protein n=1 Tax=Stachybotrys chlorohalonatus (strain IBT 40285) TaxID=1283841 RepID=A0A084QWD5_STAC4|nr:hypothetical protein S40285_01568 [Stachybotrys chlorohalonata IBT 40285]